MTARGPEVASRVGLALGAAITICFVTGMISHWIQHPPGWFVWPAHPVWLYRLTQGVHVVTGIAAIPLLLVKLWAVYPRLFDRPLLGGPRRMAERGSIAVLVGAVVFQLVTGLFNIAQFYPWVFFFTTTHYAMAWVGAGALLVHVAVKLPVIRDALSRPITDPASGQKPGVSRRAVLSAAGVAGVAAVLSVAGQTVGLLRPVSVLAPRGGRGPQGVPINRTAAAAGVESLATDPGYLLTVVTPTGSRSFSLAELSALPQTTARLPIACVEGWSATADWTGVRLRDLLGNTYADVRFVSLETSGLYGTSVLPAVHARADDTLIALALDGSVLDLDHGYPCRLIAPSRPGVLQTKWLDRIEVLE